MVIYRKGRMSGKKYKVKRQKFLGYTIEKEKVGRKEGKEIEK